MVKTISLRVIAFASGSMGEFDGMAAYAAPFEISLQEKFVANSCDVLPILAVMPTSETATVTFGDCQSCGCRLTLRGTSARFSNGAGSRMTADKFVARRDRMHRFVTHLQVLAGCLHELPSGELLDRFEQLASDIPEGVNQLEQRAISDLLNQAIEQLGRVLQREISKEHPVDAKVFRCTMRKLRTVVRPFPRHLREFTEIIDRRFSESDLSLEKVAAEMQLSPWHLTRLVRQHTGCGVASHLHRNRIRRAMELLAHSTMTVKEISARVGYVRTSQFDRRFRAWCRTTPSEYRAMHTAVMTTSEQ